MTRIDQVESSEGLDERRVPMNHARALNGNIWADSVEKLTLEMAVKV